VVGNSADSTPRERRADRRRTRPRHCEEQNAQSAEGFQWRDRDQEDVLVRKGGGGEGAATEQTVPRLSGNAVRGNLYHS